jgi:uncharacterized protein (DUF934 family)
MQFIESTQPAWQQAAQQSPEQWRAAQHPAEAGVLVLDNAADVQALDAELDLKRFAAIVLQFPKWTDGRAYSQARLLRQRLGYRGELRAAGDVVVDMALQLARTGFDVALLREGQRAADGVRSLGFFDGLLGAGPSFYQGDVRETRPAFLRGAAATSGAAR